MPNPPTAATLAMLVPIVIARRRATALSRSPGLCRDVAFKRALCNPVSFGFVTAGDSAVIRPTHASTILGG
jgi:hypothetical protein